ncbi:MAG: leucine-rich repeat domain-containing protein [Clostridia bacterium]|nr:leucine-rich repeat domain-containing protein [Clostridia bacterium]
MKQTIKKSLCIVLTALMLLTAAPLAGFVGMEFSSSDFVLPADATSVVDGGTTADGLTWTVYDDGELVISGEGEMQDYFTDEIDELLSEEELTVSEPDETESVNLNDFYHDPAPWSAYRDEIVTITVENGITEIGRQAFYLLYKADTVSLPESLVCIGAGAFSCMLSLEEISIPENVKEINFGAFSGCVCLKKLNIPEGLEIIGDSVFSLCLSLKEIVLPENAEGIISVDFFAGCYDLEKLIIPNGITFKTSTAFVPDISDAEKLQYMEEELNCAFQELYNLTCLSIPASFDYPITIQLISPFVKELYNYSKSTVFLLNENSYNPEFQIFNAVEITMTKKTHIIEHELDEVLSVTNISFIELYCLIFDLDINKAMELAAEDDYAYMLYVYNQISKMNFPSFMELNAWNLYLDYSLAVVNYCSVYCYEDSAQHSFYEDCTIDLYAKHFLFETGEECLNELELSGERQASGGIGNIKWEVDPAAGVLTLSGDGTIATYGTDDVCWVNASHLFDTIVFAPDSEFTAIGEYAFAGLRIKEFTFPSTIKHIENHAFDGCTALETIYIPKDSALRYYDPIMGDVLENKFNSCINHTAFVVEEGNPRYSSYDGALYNADGTELLYVPQGKTTIDIADTTKNIALYAFYMSHIETVTIPDSVESLELAFILNWVKTINIGSGVSSIPTRYGGAEFIQCFNLEEINVDVDNEYYASDENGILFNKDKTEMIKYPEGKKSKSYTVPEGVTTIGTNAFHIVECLGKITLPEGVEVIKDAAFEECWAKEISLPDSLKEIQYNAFRYGSFSEIVIPANVEKVGKGAFDSCAALEKITFLNPDTYIFDGDTYSTEEDFVYGYSDGSDTIPQETVIYGYAGSTAEAYALKYNRTFVELTDCPHTGGTANCESKAICTLCGQEYGELGNHVESTFTQEESCTVNGYTITLCDLCGKQLAFEIIPAAHAWGEWIETKTATCTQEGEETRTCGRCGEVETQPKAMTDHDYSDEWIIDTDSTCSQEGIQSRHCKNCSATIDPKPVEKKEHTFGEWYVVTEPTMLADGKKERKCSSCLSTEEETIAKLLYKEYINDQTGIGVGVTKEAYDGSDITVEIEEVFDGSQFLTNNYGKFRTWNIKTYLNGEQAQPLVPVYIRIPLPADYNANQIFVYHVNSLTNKTEQLDAEVIDGHICFYTDSFSRFIIVDESSIIITPAPEDPIEPDDPSENCDHLCHKSGILGIFWKIIRFLQKLFGMNPVCECGKAHY